MSRKLQFFEMQLLGWGGVKTEAEARKLGAYYRAVEKGRADEVRGFLRDGMDPNWRVFMESMPTLAARRKKTAVLRALLDAGADPNIERGAPLGLSVAYRNRSAVQALIAAGANVNLRGPGDLPALTDACFSGDIELVRILVEAGADLNKRCEVFLSGTRGTAEATPLMVAVWEGHTGVVRLLMEAGAKVTAKDSSKRTALDWARASRKPAAKQILSLLERAGAKANGKRSIELQPEFTEAARQPEFRRVLSELRKLTHSRPRPLLAADGAPISGGFFFVVRESRKTPLVSEHQPRLLQRGCLLFWTREQSRVGEAALGVLPTADVFEAIAAMQTNGANSGVYNEELVKGLRKLVPKHPFTLAGIGFDFLAGRFSPPVREAEELARRLYKLCPDLEDWKRVAKQLMQTGEFSLWWD